MRDPDNCGSCGSACATDEVCYDGSCTTSCPGGFTDCSGSCRDLGSDRLNCGACETACGDGEICEAGSCVVTCGTGLVNCSGVCSDTSSDPANCGACGAACALAEACVSGACRGVTLHTYTGTFPTTTSTVCSYGSCTVLGTGGGGRYFRTGDYVEETLTGTLLPSITGLDITLEMDDYTSGCAVGQILTWDVKVNGTTVGTYQYTGGSRLGRFTISRSFTFSAVAGTGTGDAYTLRYEATATVCSGGSSWNWFPGGTVILTG